MLNKASLSLIALAALALPGCAPMDSGDSISLEQRVAEQDRRLRQIQPQQANAMNEIRAMRQEIEQLKGQLRGMSGPDGGRMDNTRPFETGEATLEGQAPIVAAQTPPGGSAPAEVGATGLGETMNYAPESSAYGASRTMTMPGANPPPTTATTLPPDEGAYAGAGTYVAGAPRAGAFESGAAGAQTGSYGLPAEHPQDAAHVRAPSESTWGQADPRPVEPAAPVVQKDISLALFDAGVNSYNAHDYSSARRSFQDFLKNYPNHTQTAEASYYLAECDFQAGQFPQAALAFDNVIKKYPKSSSAPGAYLKQALCFSKMDQPAAAKARMREILTKFPNSPEAARAKSFLKTNK